jgi:hypothetical protein
VAENKNVDLVFGIISKIALISLSKSMFNNLSASSRTYLYNINIFHKKKLNLKTKYLRFFR